MGRCIHYIPEGGSLVEVTCRTFQGRFLLRPGEELNQIVKGVLAWAARLYEVQEMRAAYGLLFAAYRQAAGMLKAGEREVVFPLGSFPPASPFVLPAATRAP